jgi:predicted PurR-regulated permease PerM
MLALAAMFILYVLNIMIAYLTAKSAERRGRSVSAWMWLGLIFGPFAWLTVALLPSIRKERTV